MTDETGKQDETKPATNTTPKPSRRQIALLGAAAPVLLTLPIRRAHATGGGYDPDAQNTEKDCGVCNPSTFSADYTWEQGKETKERKYGKETGRTRYNSYKHQYEKEIADYDYKYKFKYSCIDGHIEKRVLEHKEYKPTREGPYSKRWVKA